MWSGRSQACRHCTGRGCDTLRLCSMSGCLQALWNLEVDREAKDQQVELRLSLQDLACPWLGCLIGQNDGSPEILEAAEAGPSRRHLQLRVQEQANSFQSRSAQDDLAKAVLPQSLWFSHVSEPITTGFVPPLPPTLTLAWDRLLSQLMVKVEFAPSRATSLAWKHASRCQVKFRDQESQEVCVMLALTDNLISIPISNLPAHGCEVSAAIRVGDASLWSPWSEFGERCQLLQPAVCSPNGHITVAGPVNHKVALDWSRLCCDLGTIPVECVVTLLQIHSESKDEVLLARCTCTACSKQHNEDIHSDQSDRDHVEVAAHGFKPGERYQILLYAAAALPRLHPRKGPCSAPVARSEPFQWPDISEEWSCLVDWALPMPQPLGRIMSRTRVTPCQNDVEGRAVVKQDRHLAYHVPFM